MKKKLTIFSVTIIIILVVFLKTQYGNQEYILTNDDENRISEFVEQNPDANEIVGKTYRVYYTDDAYLIVGNLDDAFPAFKKLKK